MLHDVPVALLPENRMRSGVRENPFAHVLRDPPRRRTAVLQPDEILRWMTVAPLPVVIAVTIGALAPALRLHNVVDLRRDQLSMSREFLTVAHKADRETGLPLTVAISPGLRQIVLEVERLLPADPYVVPLTGGARTKRPKTSWRYWQLVKMIKQSISLAGLTYGRRQDAGVTFHSLRHSLNTWLARQRDLSSAERRRAMGHQTSQMSDWYEHLAGADTVRPLALIDERLPIAATALARLRAAETPRQVPARRRPSTDFPGPRPH